MRPRRLGHPPGGQPPPSPRRRPETVREGLLEPRRPSGSVVYGMPQEHDGDRVQDAVEEPGPAASTPTTRLTWRALLRADQAVFRARARWRLTPNDLKRQRDLNRKL